MKKSHLLVALCSVVFSVITLPSHAALISVLGGQAYYDDVADLTWLADANAGAGSAFDDGSPDGKMTWLNANDWTESLNINGVTGWRLPNTGDTSCSYNCIGSEMGNLFYNVLGGSQGELITTTHNANYDLFANVFDDFYWSETELVSNANKAWAFYFYDGFQLNDDKRATMYAWAVHSGDVSAVPTPAALWLLGSGLLGLIGIARRNRT